jgi:hypothetical protein
VSRDYTTDMAERAIQAFSNDYFKELVLPNGGPILHLLACSKAEAAESVLALINVDAEDPRMIRELQNKVRMHLDLLRWVSQTINEGEQIYAQMKIEEREDMQLAILTRGGDTTMVDD